MLIIANNTLNIPSLYDILIAELLGTCFADLV